MRKADQGILELPASQTYNRWSKKANNSNVLQNDFGSLRAYPRNTTWSATQLRGRPLGRKGRRRTTVYARVTTLYFAVHPKVVHPKVHSSQIPKSRITRLERCRKNYGSRTSHNSLFRSIPESARTSGRTTVLIRVIYSFVQLF